MENSQSTKLLSSDMLTTTPVNKKSGRSHRLGQPRLTTTPDNSTSKLHSKPPMQAKSEFNHQEKEERGERDQYNTSLCLRHVNCRPIPKSEFQELLKNSVKIGSKYTHLIDNGTIIQWIDGMVIMRDMSISELWSAEACCFCYVEDFLDDCGRLPFLFGLRVMDENMALQRCFSYWVNEGENARSMLEWVDNTIKRVGAKNN